MKSINDQRKIKLESIKHDETEQFLFYFSLYFLSQICKLHISEKVKAQGFLKDQYIQGWQIKP